jgi:hypothetical protein
MHRSGTSFLVRALNLAGLWIGRDEHLDTVEGRAMPGNPRGNYENRSCITINDGILSRSGGTWHNPPGVVTALPEDFSRMRCFCQALKQGMPAEYQRWGWKDPRTVLTLDLWIHAIAEEPFIVGSLRHPSAVAHSLLARDGIPLAQGYRLWMGYNRLLMRHITKYPHALIRFDVDGDELSERVVQICRQLGLNDNPGTTAGWFDKGLVRNKDKEEDSPYFKSVAPLWEEMVSACQKWFKGGTR